MVKDAITSALLQPLYEAATVNIPGPTAAARVNQITWLADKRGKKWQVAPIFVF